MGRYICYVERLASLNERAMLAYRLRPGSKQKLHQINTLQPNEYILSHLHAVHIIIHVSFPSRQAVWYLTSAAHSPNKLTQLLNNHHHRLQPTYLSLLQHPPPPSDPPANHPSSPQKNTASDSPPSPLPTHSARSAPYSPPASSND